MEAPVNPQSGVWGPSVHKQDTTCPECATNDQVTSLMTDPRNPSPEQRQTIRALLGRASVRERSSHTSSQSEEEDEASYYHTVSLKSLEANGKAAGAPMALLLLMGGGEDDASLLHEAGEAERGSTSLHRMDHGGAALTGTPLISLPYSLLSLPLAECHQEQVYTAVSIEAKCVWLNDAFMERMLEDDKHEAVRATNCSVNGNLTVQRHILGFIKNMELGKHQPICFWSVLFPSKGLAQIQKICLWACELLDTDGQSTGRAGRVCKAVLMCPDLGVSPDTQLHVLMQQHMAYQFAPCMVTVLDNKGSILTQNAESVACLGCHTTEHQHCSMVELLDLRAKHNNVVRMMNVLDLEDRAPHPPTVCGNYLAVLFYEQQELLDEMHATLDRHEPFLIRMEIRSPLLRVWLGARVDQEVWHRVHVIRLVDPTLQQLHYCLAQVDVTDVIHAERRVAQLQQQQSELLREILPQQVIERLLAQRSSGVGNTCGHEGHGTDGEGPIPVRYAPHLHAFLHDSSSLVLPGAAQEAPLASASAPTSLSHNMLHTALQGTLSNEDRLSLHSLLDPSIVEHLKSSPSCSGSLAPYVAAVEAAVEAAGTGTGAAAGAASAAAGAMSAAAGAASAVVGAASAAAGAASAAAGPPTARSPLCAWEAAWGATALAAPQLAIQQQQQQQQQQDELLPSPSPPPQQQYSMTHNVSMSSLRRSFQDGASDHRWPSASASHVDMLRNKSVCISLTEQDVMDLATFHEEVTILFADIKGFTSMVNQLHPSQVLLFLNHLYSTWDELLETCGVYKVETIGDCYMAAAGLFSDNNETGTKRLGGYDPTHARAILDFAKAMLTSSQAVNTPLGSPVQVRIGIHSGPCSSGVVGQRMPRFCLFGDTVNTASRMESNGVPGCIHASKSTVNLLPDERWIHTGGIIAKGKGIMQTSLLPVLLPEAEVAARQSIEDRARRSAGQMRGVLETTLSVTAPVGSSKAASYVSFADMGPFDNPTPSRANTRVSLDSNSCGGDPCSPRAQS